MKMRRMMMCLNPAEQETHKQHHDVMLFPLLSGDLLRGQQVFQLLFVLRERQVDGEPEEDDPAQQGER